MLIRAIRAGVVELENRTLQTAYKSQVTHRQHLFVEVETEDGIRGIGEGSPLPHFSGERAVEMRSIVDGVFGPALAGVSALDADAVQRKLDQAMPHHGASKAALTSAVFDAVGKRLGVPLATLFGGAAGGSVPTVGAIGIEPVEVVVRRAEELVAAGHRSLKLKVGGDVRRDVATVLAVRAAVGDAVAIRADANAGYDRPSARRFARGVADVDLEYFEQPLPAHDLDGLAQLRAAGFAPIAVDESLFGLADALEIVRRGAADVFVIKLIKLGGLHVARKVVALAEAAGLSCTAVSPYETDVGVAANLHLTATSAAFRHACEVGAGVSACHHPAVAALPFDAGAMSVPTAPGLGVGTPEAGWYAAA